jgi:hypothetical protein
MSRAVITPGGLKRIVRSIEYTERITKNDPAARAKYPQAGWNPGTYLAKTGTTAIPVKSGLQAGSGTVRIWRTSAGLQSDSGVDVTAYNPSTAYTVAANTFIYISLIDGSDWYVSLELCP